MGLPKRLTEMQMKFAEHYVFGDENGPMTKTEAAIKAGYSPKRARQEGSELTNPRRSSGSSFGGLSLKRLYSGIDDKSFIIILVRDIACSSLSAK